MGAGTDRATRASQACDGALGWCRYGTSAASALAPSEHSGAEALRHIEEVVAMVVAELIEVGEVLPADEAGSASTLVSVSV